MYGLDQNQFYAKGGRRGELAGLVVGDFPKWRRVNSLIGWSGFEDHVWCSLRFIHAMIG